MFRIPAVKQITSNLKAGKYRDLAEVGVDGEKADRLGVEMIGSSPPKSQILDQESLSMPNPFCRPVDSITE